MNKKSLTVICSGLVVLVVVSIGFYFWPDGSEPVAETIVVETEQTQQTESINPQAKTAEIDNDPCLSKVSLKTALQSGDLPLVPQPVQPAWRSSNLLEQRDSYSQRRAQLARKAYHRLIHDDKATADYGPLNDSYNRGIRGGRSSSTTWEPGATGPDAQKSTANSGTTASVTGLNTQLTASATKAGTLTEGFRTDTNISHIFLLLKTRLILYKIVNIIQNYGSGRLTTNYCGFDCDNTKETTWTA